MTKFNMQVMREICNMKEKQFKKYAKYNKDTKSFFKDNDSKILGVAHLDSVCKPTHFTPVVLPHRELIFSPTLDDRLGAFLLLDHLPKMGIKFDVLLTTDEEIGRSTADLFETSKKYNWMFQFDRAGNDLVMYDYETPELEKMMKKMGWKVGQGMFSDISELEHLGCKGFNFGVCYDDYHSYNAYADLTALKQVIKRFKTFYDKVAGIHFPHTASTSGYPRSWHRPSDHGYPYDDYEYGSWKYKADEDDDKHDIWTYTCMECQKYVRMDLNTANRLQVEAADEDLCIPCYNRYYANVYN